MKLKSYTIFIFVFTFILFHCAKPVPTDDLIKARTSIEEVSSYNLEGDAKGYLDKAIEQLKQAHESLPTENFNVAKEKAEYSFNLSRLAMYSAYPTLLDAKKQEYEKSIQKAEEANAEVLAKEDFEVAKSFYKEAEEGLQLLKNKEVSQDEVNKIDTNNFASSQEKQNTLKKLDENLLLYALINDRLDKAIKSSNVALETSLSFKDSYLNELEVVKQTFNKAKNYNIQKYEPEKSAYIENQISETGNLIQNNMLKQAYLNLQSLKTEVEDLYNLAISKYSEEMLKSATSSYERTQNNVNRNRKILGTNEAKINETLLASKEALENAQKDHNDKKYESSIQYSEEVIKLSQIIEDLIYNSNLAYQRNLKLEEERRLREEEELRKQQELSMDEVKEPEETTETQNIDENLKLIYTVRKTRPAECLWRIAEKVYNDPKQWRRIYEANKDQIKNPNLIYPGQQLRILK